MISQDLPLDYPTILKGRIERSEITWHQAFDWLQSRGMYAHIAKYHLGPSGDEVDTVKKTV